MLASRLLRDKGVDDFVEAARRLRARHPSARWVLVGSPDPGNPASIDETTLRAWVTEGTVEWWGHCTDMAQTLGRASLVVLPSWREGLPLVLAEAAACGRAIVTTATAGCREVVLHERSGLLVAPRDPTALTQACHRLLADPALRANFGRASRVWAETELSIEKVVAAHLALYSDLL
jgi:glycosyltransferase involved in cell wall biosynthesis